jgi:hypothetical protein
VSSITVAHVRTHNACARESAQELDAHRRPHTTHTCARRSRRRHAPLHGCVHFRAVQLRVWLQVAEFERRRCDKKNAKVQKESSGARTTCACCVCEGSASRSTLMRVL